MAIKIDKFAGMGDKGMYWLENASVKQLNGQDIITPDYGMLEFLNSTDDLSNFTPMNSMTSFGIGSDVSLDLLGIDFVGKMWLFDPILSANAIGNIHSVTATGSGTDQILKSQNPGILTTANENILYASAHHLGMGYKRIATAVGATSITVNLTDFTALGLDTVVGSNKVYNLDTGEEYTITSITGAGNDTINFSAPTTAPSVGDEIVSFIDNKFKYDVENEVAEQFGNQATPQKWARQIKLIGDVYYSLNGNYLASLDSDEATFDATAKQLPLNTQASCMDTNSSRILIGSEYRGQGRLLLWDGFSPGWLNILDVEEEPSSITAYLGGFLVLIGTKIYFTDGYQIKLIAQLPDTLLTSKTGGNFDSMKIVDDMVYISSSNYSANRLRSGVYIYDFNSGWTYSPISTSSGNYAYKGTVGGIQTIDTSAGIRVFTSVSVLGDAPANAICYLTSGGIKRYSMIYFVKLNKVMKISKIILELAPRYVTGQINKETGTTVAVNYGNGNISIFSPQQSSGTPSTTVIPVSAGVNYPGVIGQQLFFIDDNVAGERSYITDIADPGTINEEWTISPALSVAPDTGKDLLITNLKRCGKAAATINPRDIQKSISDENNLLFSVDEFSSDKFWFEIVVNQDGSDLDIQGIIID